MLKVIYDNEDPNVQLSGSWKPLGGETEFNGTTSLTTQPGASAKFTFEGSFVAVYGTVEPVSYTNGTSLITTYSLDGSAPQQYNGTSVASTLTAPTFNQLFYESPVLEDGPHELVVKYEGAGLRFYIDYFLVTPPLRSLSNSSSPTLEMIEDTDSRVTYSDSGWAIDQDKPSTHRATNSGSTATVSFTGTYIAAFGSVNASQGVSDITFSFDDGPPQLPMLPMSVQPQQSILSHQLYFQTPRLQGGKHNLTIRARKSNPDFYLDFFLIEPLSSPTATGASGAGTVPHISGSSGAGESRSGEGRSSEIGGIVGGVVGGTLCLIILGALVFWLWRKQQRKPYNGLGLPIQRLYSPRSAVGSIEPLNMAVASNGGYSMHLSTPISTTCPSSLSISASNDPFSTSTHSSPNTLVSSPWLDPPDYNIPPPAYRKSNYR
ncbi:hypothetical protein AMATHDRAFT_66502 [Amanita thiersii Skay4041]|uniref:Uncharacterized protein n=1 Tax=Amanita thiersii Skay4041 TaxID=703135 RepID=A0A2A9NJI4_9AGAR|nr:hypothetical protein AMATHDRAFT_66502 [Amanita thiersii Skay4041]